MFASLADKLVVTSAVNQFTPAVSMAGANAVRLNAVAIVVAASATITFDIQGSNDLQNWASLTTGTATAVGYVSSINTTAVSNQYVRVRVSSDQAAASIVTIGLNTAQL